MTTLLCVQEAAMEQPPCLKALRMTTILDFCSNLNVRRQQSQTQHSLNHNYTPVQLSPEAQLFSMQEGMQQAGMAMQAHPELRNLYMVGSETLIQALMRQSVSLLRQQQVPGAAQASQQAFEMVQQVRCLPLLHAQAAALQGHCCAVRSLLAPQPDAKGELPYA